MDAATIAAKIQRMLKDLTEPERASVCVFLARINVAFPEIIREYERERKAQRFREKFPEEFPNATKEVASVVSSTLNGNYRTEALEVLKFLNEKTGRSFRAVDTNLKLIESRLKSGVSLQDCKSVVARKAREWKNDPKMSQFLRPMTLFRASNFEQYLGQKEGE